MPAHLSHLLQHLDVGCFGLLTRAYGKLIEQKGRLGYNHIDKLDFLKAYPAAQQKVFTMENIQSRFRATGLIPFSPWAALDKLNLNLGTPTSLPAVGVLRSLLLSSVRLIPCAMCIANVLQSKGCFRKGLKVLQPLPKSPRCVSKRV
jgi:hypothetical protein